MDNGIRSYRGWGNILTLENVTRLINKTESRPMLPAEARVKQAHHLINW